MKLKRSILILLSILLLIMPAYSVQAAPNKTTERTNVTEVTKITEEEKSSNVTNLIGPIIPSYNQLINYQALLTNVIIDPSLLMNYKIAVEQATEEAVEDPLAGYVYVGDYRITWYSWELVGNNIGARGVEGGMIPGYSCAVPTYDLLGKYIYVDGYGFFRADDISPKGIIDLFVTYTSEIPSYGEDYRAVFAK